MVHYMYVPLGTGTNRTYMTYAYCMHMYRRYAYDIMYVPCALCSRIKEGINYLFTPETRSHDTDYLPSDLCECTGTLFILLLSTVTTLYFQLTSNHRQTPVPIQNDDESQRKMINYSKGKGTHGQTTKARPTNNQSAQSTT